MSRAQSPSRSRIWSALLGLAGLLAVALEASAQAPAAASGRARTYVGSQACGSCHQGELARFSRYAHKARSYESVRVMRDKLTEAEYRECLACHTTGYGQPGGFRSEDETPHLANAGCEVCHGPGSVHVRSGDAADIKRSVTANDCEHCHNEERVQAFYFRPLVHGGAH